MRRCYVLGAGFSKPFGFPLASELTREVLAKMKKLSVGWMMPGSKEAYECHAKTLYPSRDFKKCWPDLEDLVTVLDELATFDSQIRGGAALDNQYPLAEKMKSDLLHILWLYLYDCQRACTSRSIAVVEDFVQKACTRGDRVISFNWDLLLEVACKRRNLSVSYNAGGEGTLHVSKPHGSLNIFSIPKGDTLSRSAFSEEMVDGDKVILMLKDPESLNEIPPGRKGSMIVPPNARKQYSEHWLQLQWKRAVEMVRESDEVVVLGYSLPEADFRPRVLLQFAGKWGREIRVVIVVDRDDKGEVLGRYKKYLKNVEEAKMSWEEWFRANS